MVARTEGAHCQLTEPWNLTGACSHSSSLMAGFTQAVQSGWKHPAAGCPTASSSIWEVSLFPSKFLHAGSACLPIATSSRLPSTSFALSSKGYSRLQVHFYHRRKQEIDWWVGLPPVSPVPGIWGEWGHVLYQSRPQWSSLDKPVCPSWYRLIKLEWTLWWMLRHDSKLKPVNLKRRGRLKQTWKWQSFRAGILVWNRVRGCGKAQENVRVSSVQLHVHSGEGVT